MAAAATEAETGDAAATVTGAEAGTEAAAASGTGRGDKGDWRLVSRDKSLESETDGALVLRPFLLPRSVSDSIVKSF